MTLKPGFSFAVATDDVLHVNVALVFQIGLPGGKPKVEISAEYELRYQMPEGNDFSEEELIHFARFNALHNAWPFLRELIDAGGRCHKMKATR